MNIAITGATSGIGEAVAKEYLKQGHFVFAFGRNKTKLAELKYFATMHNTSCETFCVDVRDFEALENICKDITSKHTIDLAIANAGISAPHVIDLPSVWDFKNIIDTNLISVHAFLHPLINAMPKGAKIAIISSLSGYVPLPSAVSYATSKAGINFYADTMRNALKNKNISVICIRPGFIDTPLTKKNRFKMPFLMNTQTATNHIIKAIDKNVKIYDFPFIFATAVKLFGMLPMKDFLIRKLTEKYGNR